MIRLLGRKTSGNVQKVVWVLEELGLPYEREDYGRQFGNTQTEEYLGLNPNAKVPTLVEGDTVVWESNSILRYLAAKAGRLTAADPAGRSRIERWMDWQIGTLDPAYLPVFREAKTPPEQRSAQFTSHVAGLGQTLGILERGMGGGKWIAGDAMTIADISIGPVVHRCLAFDIELPALTNLRRWHGEIAKRPGFQKAVG